MGTLRVNEIYFSQTLKTFYKANYYTLESLNEVFHQSLKEFLNILDTFSSVSNHELAKKLGHSATGQFVIQ